MYFRTAKYSYDIGSAIVNFLKSAYPLPLID